MKYNLILLVLFLKLNSVTVSYSKAVGSNKLLPENGMRTIR